LKAKILFPEGFEVSPAQSAERYASEEEAARTEADAIRSAAESHKSGEPLEGNQDIHLSDNEEPRLVFVHSNVFFKAKAEYSSP
jgi:hypothetical protein